MGDDLPPAVSLSLSLGTGPTGRALTGASDETRALFRERVTAVLAPYAGPAGW
jgi:hypothetical protein